MIIIIDEASAKLASFYYHGEIFKPQWKRAADMSPASDELHDEFQENCMTSSNMNYRKITRKLPDELQENCMLHYWENCWMSCRRNCQMSSRIICACMK